MNKLYFKIILIGIIILNFSCEEKIELDIPDQTPKMVVQGVLSPGENPVIDLRKSYTIAERIIDENMNMQQIYFPDLRLYKNNQLVANFIVNPLDPFSYSLNYNNFKVGEKYVLRGSAKNFPDIYAETVIPSKPNIYITNFEYSSISNNDYKFSLKINIQDNPDEENYYAYTLVSNNQYYPFYYTNFEGENNNQQDPSITQINYVYYLNDKLFNGKLKTILLDQFGYLINSWGFKAQETFWIECRSITKDYYDYKISTNKQGNNDFDIFAEPVLIKHNITGGFGVLGSSNIQRYPLTIQTK